MIHRLSFLLWIAGLCCLALFSTVGCGSEGPTAPTPAKPVIKILAPASETTSWSSDESPLFMWRLQNPPNCNLLRWEIFLITSKEPNPTSPDGIMDTEDNLYSFQATPLQTGTYRLRIRLYQWDILLAEATSCYFTIYDPVCVGAKFTAPPQPVTTAVGIPVELKAEMLLHSGELITGEDMEWEVTGVGILPSSTFTPTEPGVFDVVARYCDITSETTKITVFSGPLDHFDCQYNGQMITVSAKDQYGYDSTMSGLVDVWFGLVPGMEDTYGGQLQLSNGYGEYDISGLGLSHGIRYYFKFCLGVCSNFVLDYE